MLFICLAFLVGRERFLYLPSKKIYNDVLSLRTFVLKKTFAKGKIEFLFVIKFEAEIL